MISAEKRKKIEKYLILGVVAFLSVLFIISLIMGARDPEPALNPSQREKLTDYACQYQEGEDFEAEGMKLDCSGFTAVVYQQFSILLPPSSQEQYRKFGISASEELKKGDLVFFAIHGRGISHVGIYLGNNQFIHSPGVGKAVRIDSLTNSYFKSCFISGGKVNFDAD